MIKTFATVMFRSANCRASITAPHQASHRIAFAGPLVKILLALFGFLLTGLARYKLPKSVIFAAELPRHATGKLLKEAAHAQSGRSDNTEEVTA